MDSKVEKPLYFRMESLHLACDEEIHSQQQKIDSLTTSFEQTLASAQNRAQETVRCQGNLLKVKAKLREAEDDLVRARSVRDRKEAKRISIVDSLLARKSRVEELKRNLEELRAKRDDYVQIISQQSSGVEVSEETGSHNENAELREAISWYNNVLGFHVEGGKGVKFIFKKIDVQNPNEEFSFTVRHADDTYTLLDCNPQLDDIKELIHELNRTNGLFKFVRIMRQRFQEAAMQGILPHSTSRVQESSTVSASNSRERKEDSAKKTEHQAHWGEEHRHSKKQNRGRDAIDAIRSPGSIRRSSRLVKN